jgi:hypothetical protein
MEESLTEPLTISAAVLERLREHIPFKESQALFTAITKPEDFWRLVDTLPSDISLDLHSVAALIPCSDRDFPSDSLTPFYQDLWIANQVAAETDLDLHSPVAISKFPLSRLSDLLTETKGWTFRDGKWFCSASKVGFDIHLLGHMCDAFYFNGKPWLFCPIDEIRVGYIEFDRVFERLDQIRCDYSPIQSKLLSLSYNSTDAFIKDLKQFSPHLPPLSDFKIPAALCNYLSFILQSSATIMQQNVFTPEVDEIDEWKLSRASALAAQVSLPLDKRASYSLTPQILQARTGQPVDVVFQRNSIAELLFSSAAGEVMPLPFTSCRSQLPAESLMPFAKSTIRIFVARQLAMAGYNMATEAVLDIQIGRAHV